jgi:hypothetical protein
MLLLGYQPVMSAAANKSTDDERSNKKQIFQQFIYDITKSDFTYYYKQYLDIVRLILRRQWEIVDKEHITREDMDRAKVLVDIMNTVSTINGSYNGASALHRTPMQAILRNDDFGVRPGSRTRTLKITDEDLKAWEEEDERELAEEEAELKALEEKYSSYSYSSSAAAVGNRNSNVDQSP